MTVANSRPSSTGPASARRGADDPRSSFPPVPANRKPKPTLDVVDLLLMNAFKSSTVTLPDNPATPVGNLVDEIVADHLTRATQPSTDTSMIATPPDDAGVLQQEIDALLEATPSAPAPAETLSDDATALSRNELDALLADSPPPAEEALSVDELDTLLASDASPADPAAPTALPAIEDDGESRLLEAEDVLAKELQELMAETSVTGKPPETTAPPEAPSSPAGTEAEAAAPAPVPLAAPDVELLPTSLTADPGLPLIVRPRRFAGLFADIALVAAQVADMPFRWMDVMDKNLLGVAALIMLLSGLALKAFAWWMGVH